MDIQLILRGIGCEGTGVQRDDGIGASAPTHVEGTIPPRHLYKRARTEIVRKGVLLEYARADAKFPKATSGFVDLSVRIRSLVQQSPAARANGGADYVQRLRERSYSSGL